MYKVLLESLNQGADSYIPIWLMRQAGRYLPEYREIRKKFRNFLDFCFTPEAASIVTIQPLRRFDLDAAILFSDILVIPHALGIEVSFVEGEGPVLNPISSEKEIKNLELKRGKDLEKIFNTVQLVAKEIKNNYPTKTLIGFAGSPWTLACYMLQGKGNQKFERAITFAREKPEILKSLIETLITTTIFYLKKQVEAGAEVVKLFDSWAGLLDQEGFRQWVIEPNKRIVTAIKREFPTVPIIGFPRKAGKLYLEYSEKVGVDCLALDQEVDISWVLGNIGNIAIQGNFDNVLLATSKKAIKQEVEKILRITSGHKYIFNLGHGVLPETPIENIHELISSIRDFKA